MQYWLVISIMGTEMDKLSSTKSAISEYRNSDFQISGSVISSHKNIHRVLKKVWKKRTFRNCSYYRSGDVLFADMEVFKGQGNDTETRSIKEQGFLYPSY